MKIRRGKNNLDVSLVISAPLGDFRHMAHIGRDGADFGEEHLFVSSMEYLLETNYLSNDCDVDVPDGKAEVYRNSLVKRNTPNTGQNNNERKLSKTAYVNQHDSPIIKSAIPISQAAAIIKTESHDSGNYNHFDPGSPLTSQHSLPLLRDTLSHDDSNSHSIYNTYSIGSQKTQNDIHHNDNLGDRYVMNSCESFTSDLDIVGSMNGIVKKPIPPQNIGGECTSLLGDVLAVMDLPQFSSLQSTTFKRMDSKLSSDNNCTTNSIEEINTASCASRSQNTDNDSDDRIQLIDREIGKLSIGLDTDTLNDSVDIMSEKSRDFDIGGLVVNSNEHNDMNACVNLRLDSNGMVHKAGLTCTTSLPPKPYSSAFDSRYSQTMNYRHSMLEQCNSVDSSLSESSGSQSCNSAMRSINIKNYSNVGKQNSNNHNKTVVTKVASCNNGTTSFKSKSPNGYSYDDNRRLSARLSNKSYNFGKSNMKYIMSNHSQDQVLATKLKPLSLESDDYGHETGSDEIAL